MSSGCCHSQEDHCHPKKESRDYLLIICSVMIVLSYLLHISFVDSLLDFPLITKFTGSVYSLINTMFIGIVVGIIFMGLLAQIPREFVIGLLGRERNGMGILRATMAGVLLDLCSHGILMVGAKLYERGASLGQVMAFLIASPWNSVSLTLILWALVGFKWMMTFLLVSMLIGFVSGLIFEKLVANKTLPDNPNRIELPDDFNVLRESKNSLKQFKPSFTWFKTVLLQGLKDSRMVLRWIFFGVILAATIRILISPEQFQTFFGPTLIGLGLTLLAATVMEVCSEGTLPVASDLLTRANAPGNSFTFLMAGVATDYTEIMVLKEATGHWKIPLFLPLVSLPQILMFALLFNSI